MKKTKAVLPGSFDPVTLGHLDIIERGAALFDEIHIALGVNSEKSGFFPFERRLAFLDAACRGFDNVKIVRLDGLLVDYAIKNNISVIVKGVRNVADFEYETALALINADLCDGLETVFLPSKSENTHISSSFVREMIKYQKPLYKHLPAAVAEMIYQTHYHF